MENVSRELFLKESINATRITHTLCSQLDLWLGNMPGLRLNLFHIPIIYFIYISDLFISSNLHRARDKTDELAKVVKTIAENETFNATSEKALDNFSSGLTFLADHQSMEVQRLEEKVVQDLLQYQLICQNAKEEVKSQFALRDREITKRKQLDMNRRSKTENDTVLSNMQISKILKEIMTVSEHFEAQKISDVKDSLTNFILVEMKYHASCLEVLTMMHEDVAAIDEKKDVDVSFQLKYGFGLNLF